MEEKKKKRELKKNAYVQDLYHVQDTHPSETPTKTPSFLQIPRINIIQASTSDVSFSRCLFQNINLAARTLVWGKALRNRLRPVCSPITQKVACERHKRESEKWASCKVEWELALELPKDGSECRFGSVDNGFLWLLPRLLPIDFVNFDLWFCRFWLLWFCRFWRYRFWNSSDQIPAFVRFFCRNYVL